MRNSKRWPEELWMARCDDEPNYYISVGDCPRLPTDRRYVLALMPDAVRTTVSDALDAARAALVLREYSGEQVDADAWQRIRDAQNWLATVAPRGYPTETVT